MKVLLIGNGGREHALAWKLAASARVTALFVAPGNPGTAQVADNVPLDPMNFPAIEEFIRANGIEFVVIGPEDPLAAGLADRVRAMKIPVFGPSAEAAQLEADKWFAKELMRHQAIPTAEARTFTDAFAAEEYVQHRGGPLVIKAAGLAKGIGVIICPRTDIAVEAIRSIMRDRAHGAAGARVVIEEMLAGPECSIPRAPPAPTLLSTTTGTPQRCDSRAPSTRASWSAVVPGVDVTTNWIACAG